MAEYIERERVMDVLLHEQYGYLCEDAINSIPTVDARLCCVGKWEDAMQSCHDSPHVKCSVCGEYYWRYFKKFNFCPNCGAQMDMREES